MTEEQTKTRHAWYSKKQEVALARLGSIGYYSGPVRYSTPDGGSVIATHIQDSPNCIAKFDDMQYLGVVTKFLGHV
jgi:hypothetical protein